MSNLEKPTNQSSGDPEGNLGLPDGNQFSEAHKPSVEPTEPVGPPPPPISLSAAPAGPPSLPQGRPIVTDDQRRALLSQHLHSLLTKGMRLESQSDFQAVVVKGKPVNHILHLLLTVLFCGTWLLVWGFLALTGGEKRSVVSVDVYGQVSMHHL